MRTAASIFILTLTTSLAGCDHAANHHDFRAGALPAETTEPSAPFLIALPPLPPQTPNHSTSYEHRDHEELPVGTRIYYVNGLEMIVGPGQTGPANRQPDVVIVPDTFTASRGKLTR